MPNPEKVPAENLSQPGSEKCEKINSSGFWKFPKKWPRFSPTFTGLKNGVWGYIPTFSDECKNELQKSLLKFGGAKVHFVNK